MRIAALSDFHIGTSPARDGFRHDPSRFGQFLERLEAEHDKVVLLGTRSGGRWCHASIDTRTRKIVVVADGVVHQVMLAGPGAGSEVVR